MGEYTENWQAQVDEIQALQSIFEHDFKITAITGLFPSSDTNEAKSDCSWNAETLAAVDDPPSTPWTISCQISIHIDPPYTSSSSNSLEEGQGTWQFAIYTAPQGSSSSDNSGSEISNQPPPTHGIKYLSPVILSFNVSSTYPSSTPPVFSIAAMWLSRCHATEIENELLKLWDVSIPVIWTWADWLHNSLMEYLVQLNRDQMSGGSGGYYLLDAEKNDDDNDSEEREEDLNENDLNELQLEEQGIEDRLISLLHYSAAREMQLFRQNMHTCTICFEDQRGTEFLRLDCGHVFCTSCILEQSNIHIREGNLDALKCPEPGCKEPLGVSTLRRILDPEVFERWETLTLQRALDQMPDAAYCPRCGTLSLEDLEENCADCPKCFYIFCTLCNEGRHPGVQCVSAETRLAMLRKKAEGGGSAAVAELRKKEHEMMSLAAIEKTTKPCPACGMAIQRSEGCNKMVCGNCNAFFCYKCGKQISGYDHYKSGGECVLFDEAEILRWERRWQEQAGAHAAAAFRNDYLLEFGGDNDHGIDEIGAGEHNNRRGGGGGRGGGGNRGGGALAAPICNCPSCGQPNYRFANNNHLHCWSCSRHFCAVCRTVLQRRGGGMHFGPKGCPQHS